MVKKATRQQKSIVAPVDPEKVELLQSLAPALHLKKSEQHKR